MLNPFFKQLELLCIGLETMAHLFFPYGYNVVCKYHLYASLLGIDFHLEYEVASDNDYPLNSMHVFQLRKHRIHHLGVLKINVTIHQNTL